MRSVNLIPQEVRLRTGHRRLMPASIGTVHVGVFVLAAAVVLMLIGVLTSNTISDRKAQLQSLQAQVAQATATAQRLAPYTTFIAQARQREEAVRQTAAGRFDWQTALAQLSRVVPADASFQSLNATASTGTAGAAGAGASGGIRGAINAPAFEITGCTASQDEVARLMGRLRLISGVTRVTLGSSQKSGSSASAESPKTGTASGCRPNTPTFDLVVFFTPLPAAGPTGATSTTGGTP